MTFDELESGMIRSGLTDIQLESYSDRLRGTRVRWSGFLAQDAGPKRVTYVSTNGVIQNIEFSPPLDVAAESNAQQVIVFIGTIERVSLAEIFPPMPKAYVVLKDAKVVQLQEPTAK